MKHLSEIPSLRLQPANRKVYIPFSTTDKKRNAAIMLLSPDVETSHKLMNLPYVYNPQYFTAYYLDKKVDTYINPKFNISASDVQEFIDARNEAVLHKLDIEYDKNPDRSPFKKKNIRFNLVGGTSTDKREIVRVFNDKMYNYWCDKFRLKIGDPVINIYIHTSLAEFEDYLRENEVEDYRKYIIYSYTDGNNIHVLSTYCYRSEIMDGPYENYLTNELISYIIGKINPKLNKKVKNYIAVAASNQFVYLMENKEKLEDTLDKKVISMCRLFYNMIEGRYWNDLNDFIKTGNANHIKDHMIRNMRNNFSKIINEYSLLNEKVETMDHEIHNSQLNRYRNEKHGENIPVEKNTIRVNAYESLGDSHPELFNEKKLQDMLNNSENLVEDFNNYLQSIITKSGSIFSNKFIFKGDMKTTNVTIITFYEELKGLQLVEHITEQEAFRFVAEEYVPESLTEEGCRALIKTQIAHNKVLTSTMKEIIANNYELLGISKRKAEKILKTFDKNKSKAILKVKEIFSDSKKMQQFCIKNGVYDFRELGLGCLFLGDDDDIYNSISPAKLIGLLKRYDAAIFAHGGSYDTEDEENIEIAIRGLKTEFTRFARNNIDKILAKNNIENRKEIINKVIVDTDKFIDESKLNINNFSRSFKNSIISSISNYIDDNSIITDVGLEISRFLYMYKEIFDWFDKGLDIRDKNDKIWQGSYINTLQVNNLMNVQTVIRQLKVEGFKNILVMECNPGHVELPDDIKKDPNIKVTIATNSVLKEDFIVDEFIDCIYELSLIEQQGDDILYELDYIHEDGILTTLGTIARKAVDFIIAIWKKIIELIKKLWNRIIAFFNSESVLNDKNTDEMEKEIEVTAITATGSTVKVEKRKLSSVKAIDSFYKNSCRSLNSLIDKLSNKETKKIKTIEKSIKQGKFKKKKDIKESYIYESKLTTKSRNNLEDKEYGLPDERKYPLNDESHVRSAIRFFNYVDEDKEKELARNILKKIEEYHMKVNVGKNNRFSKYYDESTMLLIETSGHDYWYHLVPKGTKMDLGIISPYYMNKVGMNGPLNNALDKYRDRISDKNKWGYSDKDPEDLTKENIFEALNKFRKSNHGSAMIYLFRYPPYKKLGPNMRDILKGKDLYRIDLNRIPKSEIEDIYYGTSMSHSDGKQLAKEDYDISIEDYFANYDDNNPMAFSTINHIAITMKEGRIDKKYIEKVSIPNDITDSIYNESTILNEDTEYLYNTEKDVKNIIDSIPMSQREDITDNSGEDEYEDCIIYRKVLNGAFLKVYRDINNPDEAAFTIGAALQARGKGVTDQLIKDATEKCRKLGIKTLCWKCAFDNKHSYNLAKRNGFIDKTKDDYNMYWLEKDISNTKNESTILNENIIFDDEDQLFNLSSWFRGRHILFIAGLAGSGKSTTGKHIAMVYNATYIELDKIYNYDFIHYKPMRRDEEIIAEFAKKYKYKTIPSEMKEDEWNKYFFECLDYIMDVIKKDTKHLYVIEGIQVTAIAKYHKWIYDYPMIIKGTSILNSSIRSQKRFKEVVRRNIAFGFKQDDMGMENLVQLMKSRAAPEKRLNKLRKAIKYANESFNSNIIGLIPLSENYDEVLNIADSLSEDEFKRISLTDKYEDSPNVIYRDIYKDDDGNPIGFLDVYVFDTTPHIAQITAAVKPQYRNRGYMSMMLGKLLSSSVGRDHNLKFYVWNVHPDNIASAKVALKNGFVYYGIDNGYGAEAYVYALTKEEEDYIKYIDRILPKENNIIRNHNIIEGTGYIGRLNESGKLSEIYIDSEYFLESVPVDSNRLRKYLYNERIKTNNQQLEQLRRAKELNPWIKRIYIDISMYKEYNVFIDFYYYHSTFLKNNTIKYDRGVNLYFEFLNKMINNKEYDMYTKKTIYIPMFPSIWGTYSPDIYDYSKNVNILSTIVRLAKVDPEALVNAWGNKLIVFMGQNGYFRIDFSTFTFNKIPKFKKLCDKLLKNEVITQADLIADNDDVIEITKDSTTGIVTDIIDKIEKSTSVVIDNVATGSGLHNPLNKADHLRIRKLDYNVEDPEMTFIGVLVPADDTTFVSTMVSNNNIIKNSKDIKGLII